MVECCDFMSTIAGDYEFADRPKSEWLVFATNPYNGRVFVKVKGPASAMRIGSDLIRDVADKLGQLDGMLGRRADLADFFDLCQGRIDFDEFEPCPFCGERPEYDSESHEIVCCGGHLKLYDFSGREDAVRYWNLRSRRVA